MREEKESSVRRKNDRTQSYKRNPISLFYKSSQSLYSMRPASPLYVPTALTALTSIVRTPEM